MVVTTVAVVARTIGASGMFKVYGRRCTMIIMIITFFVLIRKKIDILFTFMYSIFHIPQACLVFQCPSDDCYSGQNQQQTPPPCPPSSRT